MSQFLVSRDPEITWRYVRPPFGAAGRRNTSANAPLVFDLFWARSAIYQALRILRLERHHTVLLPAYHCAAAVEPVIRYGAQVRFYNVTRGCVVDLADIERRIDASTRAVLAIHYFGLPQQLKGLRELCRERGLRLIEDCAHILPISLSASGTLGSLGDVSVFSWRKFLPIYDGGRLQVNDRALAMELSLKGGGALFGLRVLKNTAEKCVQDSGFATGRIAAAGFRAGGAVLRRLVPRSATEATALGVNNYDLHFDLTAADLRMSSISRVLLRSADLEGIVAARRENWQRILRGVLPLPGVRPLLEQLPDAASPWAFPMVSSDNTLHHDLRSRGIEAFTWGGVIHPSLALDEFPDARHLYDRLVLLPVHQTLTGDAIETMLRVLRDVTAPMAVDQHA